MSLFSGRYVARVMVSAAAGVGTMLFSCSTALAGGTPPPPPPPAGTISTTSDAYYIAPTTVTFTDSGNTIAVNSIREIDWTFARNGYNDGSIVGDQHTNYPFLYLVNCVNNFAGQCSRYGLQGTNNWVDTNGGNGLVYQTTNPFSVSFAYQNVYNYTVTMTITDTSGNTYSTSVNVPVSQPPAPTGLNKTGGGATYVNLAWNAVPGATGYNIQMQTVAGCLFSWWNSGLVIGEKQWGGYTGTSTTINDAMLCLGSQYHAQIQAYRGSNVGPWSDWTSTFTLP